MFYTNLLVYEVAHTYERYGPTRNNFTVVYSGVTGGMFEPGGGQGSLGAH